MVECELVVPDSGNATVNGTGLGSVVEYTCDIGFDLIGLSLQVCLENDIWSDEMPVCECELIKFATLYITHKNVLYIQPYFNVQ